MRRVMNDPSYAYGEVYHPSETLEKSMTLLQTRLAKEDPAALTLEYLDTQYTGLFKMLVEHGLCAVSAYTQPMLPKEVWLRHQLKTIARYRD
jgi:hypothetical protein